MLMMQLSVIEGFYGRSWSQADRIALLPIFKQLGFQTYVYAPKSARKLRREWYEPFSDSEFEFLAEQRLAAKAGGIKWGIGFSPLGLYELDPKTTEQLKTKILQLSELSPNVFCLLFDDMRGDKKLLAKHQLSVSDVINQHLNSDVEVTFCPSYYSTDPILENLFGERPANYWRELGSGLDPKAQLFWTGEKVCSTEYDRFNLEFISNEFRRAPVLWDNYPVNDSKRLSSHLLLKPFAQRQAWLADYLQGHFANPMNQAWLSLLPLSTLAPVYQDHSEELEIRQQSMWRQTLRQYGGDAQGQLEKDYGDFHDFGLEAVDELTKSRWQSSYQGLASKMAAEVSDWLDGGYAFDEACLTD